MPRQRTIIGIGEALLADLPDRTEPAGLAALAAISAVRLGHRGTAVSRLGQDAAASELIGHLNAAKIDASHLQSDPDLATGRLLVRPIGSTVKRSVDARAAFDNLQWDFDLTDVAQEADAVVFGALAMRSSQTWSTIQRFLAECAAALRLLNLLNRANDDLDRAQALSALSLSDAAVLDVTALRAIMPAASDTQTREAVLQLLQHNDLAFIVLLDDLGKPTLHFADEQVESNWCIDTGADGVLEAWIVALLHGILSAWDFGRSIELANRVSQYTAEQRCDPIPDDWLNM